ncbi:MAG: hypothetical protein R3F62_23215 [Planctomycetota bacterium]
MPLQEVQKQVGALRQAWIVVEREFTRATRADKAGDHVAARAGFAEVLRLEPSPRNRYHELALERLAYAEAAIRDEIQSDLRGLEHLLEAPLEGLRQAELAEAGRLARAVREHPGVTGSQTARVEAAIKVFATRLDAEERVKDALFANDLDACGRLEGQLAFLDAWLPVGAPERKGLSDAQERLGKRLARLASTRRLSEASK